MPNPAKDNCFLVTKAVGNIKTAGKIRQKRAYTYRAPRIDASDIRAEKYSALEY